MITPKIFFDELIANGDAFNNVHSSVLWEFKDYIKMRQKNLPTNVVWGEIKHNHVMKSGRTVWSLTTEYFTKLYANKVPIGMTHCPLDFIEYILDQVTKLPTFDTAEEYFKLN